MKTKIYLALFIGVLIILFALQNSEMTEVNFLFWDIRLSRVLIILGSFFIGLIVGLLLSFKKRT